jgi:hypothetical protein
MLGKNPGAAETAKRIPVGSVGVEVGVWRGDSTALFLENAAHVHCVDPWSVTAYEGSPEFGDYAAYIKRYAPIVGSEDPRRFQEYYDRIYRDVCDRFPSELVTVHRCTSAEFFRKFTWRVDWVYVDGLHNYESCLSDLHGARSILKPGGFIFGDDYGNKPGVTEAVHSFSSDVEVFGRNQYQIYV